MKRCQICKQEYKEETAYVNKKRVCQFCFEKYKKPTNGTRTKNNRTRGFWEKWVTLSNKNKKA